MPYVPAAMPSHTTDDAPPQRRMSGALGSISSSLPLMPKHKPEIDIKLDDQQPGFVPAYTTLEPIKGTASVTCDHDTPYDNIHIIFQGASKTFVEKTVSSAPTTPRTQAYHNFLRLVQPMEDAGLPDDRVARAGVTYKMPFTFVVPTRLLPQACTHSKQNDSVGEAHLLLPPSLGDPMMAGDGKSLLDDLAPAMSMISYGIRVIITKKSCKPGTARPNVLADAMKKIRIVPATEEQPPLSIGDQNDDYALTRVKSIKKGMFKGKLGTLTMSASQPSPLRLPYIKSKKEGPVTTMANIQLHFEPSDSDAMPPKLGHLSVKLKCSTFFSTAPMRNFPAKASAYIYDSHRGVFVETLTLSARNVESVQWTKNVSRHDSAVALPNSGGVAAAPNSSKQTSDYYYTSEILVPIDLPTKSKVFVPTFHSCLVSRVYTLDLNLNAHARSASVSGATLHLKLPLQIASEGNPDARPIISAEEAASIARREADNTFEPRSIAPPADAPPPLADLRGARGSVFQAPRWGSVASTNSTYAADAGSPQRRESSAAQPGGGYFAATSSTANSTSSPLAFSMAAGTVREEGNEDDQDQDEEEEGPMGERRSPVQEQDQDEEVSTAPPGYSAFPGVRNMPPPRGNGALIGY